MHSINVQPGAKHCAASVSVQLRTDDGLHKRG